MTVDSIHNYLSDDKKDEYIEIISEIYRMTEHLNKAYPGYSEWLFGKQVKGCAEGTRNILFVRNEDGKIVAISCLKKDDEEEKICTLFVEPKCRNQGFGSLLFEESMKYLETTKPLATFSEDKLPMLTKIIEKYDWQLTEVVENTYGNGTRELCYNGKLTKKHKK